MFANTQGHVARAYTHTFTHSDTGTWHTRTHAHTHTHTHWDTHTHIHTLHCTRALHKYTTLHTHTYTHTHLPRTAASQSHCSFLVMSGQSSHQSHGRESIREDFSFLCTVINSIPELIFRVRRTTALGFRPLWANTDQQAHEEKQVGDIRCTLRHATDSDPLHLLTPSCQLRSSADTRVFRIPSFRTQSSGQLSFSYQALTTRNQLASIRRASSASSVTPFRSSLKT